MKKILHIQKVAGIAGSENHLLTLLPQLKNYGYEPTMLILAEKNKPPKDFIERMEAAGVSTNALFIQGNRDPLLIPRFVSYIRHGGYQLVHTHLIHADLYGTLAAKIAGVKLVVSTRHNDDPFRKLSSISKLIGWTTHFSNHVICISENIARFSQKFEKTPSEKITAIHYGLSSEFIKAKSSSSQYYHGLDLEADVPILGIVARLTEQKGHTILLKAMPEVLRQFPKAQLVIVGDGELRKELEQSAKQLNISHNIHFLGYRDNAAALMSSFDIFVHPSRWEGFGLVFLEAMAASLPIIATNVSAIPEIVQNDETGLLVPVDDSQALSKAICTLLADRDLAKKMGEKGHQRLNQKFTTKAMVEQTSTVYKKLLSADA